MVTPLLLRLRSGWIQPWRSMLLFVRVGTR
jgi:hypothetical protein